MSAHQMTNNSYNDITVVYVTVTSCNRYISRALGEFTTAMGISLFYHLLIADVVVVTNQARFCCINGSIKGLYYSFYSLKLHKCMI